MKAALDLQIPFFYPMWRRIALTLVCLGWAVFEFGAGTPFWGVLFGAMAGNCIWQFFVKAWPVSVEDAGGS